MNTSVPERTELRHLAGLDQPVDILWDEHAVPTIRAKNEADAYFALGYVHAGDRLFQMEMMRRLGAGKLAEILGRPAVKTDKFMRTLGLEDLARESYHHLSPEVRLALDAYAAGVNAWLMHHDGALPPEFVLLHHTPEPWTPADSLLWGRIMGMMLSGNWRDELLRALLANRLSEDKLRQLWFGLAPPPPPSAGLNREVETLARRLLAAVPEEIEARTASNAWALAPSRTETGGALLANDPHLGFSAPILWYLARIETPDLTLTGATVPGVPFHVLGQNGTVAWGITTTGSDTQDLFIERVLDDGRYETPNGPKPFRTRTEVIPVRFGAPITLKVRATRHGPVISDVEPDAQAEEGHVLALAATALQPDDRSAEALYRLNRARDWPGFVEALKSFHSPQQNLFYADIAGNIGFYAPGRVPVRARGDGSVPVPGWAGGHDWTGWVPFKALPQAYNPATGQLVNANNRIVSDDYGYLLTTTWEPSYRADRILDLLNAHPRHIAAGLAGLQTDIHSTMVDELKPLMLNMEPQTDRAKLVLDQLRDWDSSMEADLAEPLIFITWMWTAEEMIYGDELGVIYDDWKGLHPRVLRETLTKYPAWCDDVTSPREESCPRVLGMALERALDWIEARHGPDRRTWRWGDEHQAVFAHPMFRFLPVVDRLTELRIPTDGGDYTVNRGQFRIRNEDKPFTHVHGAGYRAVYDLANLDRSEYMIATGQSGNPLSPHYGDLLRDWHDGQTLRFGATLRAATRLEPLP